MPLLLIRAAASISTVQVHPPHRLPSPEEARIPPLPSTTASSSATEPAHTPVKPPSPEISLHLVPDHFSTNTFLYQPLLTNLPPAPSHLLLATPPQHPVIVRLPSAALPLNTTVGTFITVWQPGVAHDQGQSRIPQCAVFLRYPL